MLMRLFTAMKQSREDALDVALSRIELLTSEAKRIADETAARNADHAAEITRLSDSNNRKDKLLAEYRSQDEVKNQMIDDLKRQLAYSQSQLALIDDAIRNAQRAMGK